ncbi:MAG TPA: tetratricopeptide repeat protein, partial [Kofleriaceae bacterium]|nr:tetratricopeptide repeat protein [Kofleriaceae bacterium]
MSSARGALIALAMSAAVGACQRTEPLLPPGGTLTGRVAPGAPFVRTLPVREGELIEVTLDAAAGAPIRLRSSTPDGDRVDARPGRTTRVLATAGGDHELRVELRGAAAGPVGFVLRRAPDRPLTERERRGLLGRRRLRIVSDLVPGPARGPELDALLAELRAVGDLDGEGDVLYERARDLEAAGDLPGTVAALEQAIAVWRRGGQTLDEIDGLTYLAGIAVRQGDHARSEQRAREAVALAVTHHHVQREGFARATLGHALVSAGRYQAALDVLRDVRALHERNGGDPEDLFGTVLALGVVHQKLGDGEAAVAYAVEAQRLAPASGHRLAYAMARGNEGFARLRLLDDPATALARFEETLPAFEEGGDPFALATHHDALGKTLVALERPGEALPHVERALALIADQDQPRLRAEILIDRGEARLAVGDGGGAGDLRDGLALAEQVDASLDAVRARRALARAARAAGDRAEARAQLEAAIATMETVRSPTAAIELRTTQFALVRDVYDQYIDLLAGDGPAAAFAASQRARARTLIEAAGLDRRAPPEAVPLAEVARLVGVDAAVVELAVGSARSFAWVIQGDRLEQFVLPPRRVLEPLVRRWHAATSAADADAARRAVGDVLRPVLAAVRARRVWRRRSAR